MTCENDPNLCDWRCPPSPWKTWSGRCRALSREPGPPGLGSGPSSWPGTSRACRDTSPEPPRSDRASLSAHCCCWPWSRESLRSARSHRRAEEEETVSKISFPHDGDSCRYYSTALCVCVCSLCRCPVCSGRCERPERWCLAGCCLHPGCLSPLHP